MGAANDYAAARQNIFFTANNETSADGNLTGQCVTLVKWFMQDLSSVPSPFAARGDARYVGKTLVNQGHATEVAYADRREGDIVCYEYGTYGHIAVQMSDGRVFEENVNMGGVARKLVDGAYVYASRIGSENESWRSTKNPHVYRLKTYKGDNDMPTEQEVRYNITNYLGYEVTADTVKYYTTRPWQVLMSDIGNDMYKRQVNLQHLLDEANKELAEGGDNSEFVETKVYVKKV